MSNENELLEPLATEAGQQAIAAAIRGFGSLENALRAERAAETAIQKASDASDSATAASGSATLARNWATKMDTYVDTETIVIPAEEEGEEDTEETVQLFSARYYALMAQDIYNNLQFDNEPTENSTNIVSSGAIYDALDLKADKSTTYTKTEIDTALATKQDTLMIDNSPTEDSTNLVKSGGVYAALEDKADNATTLSGYGITDAYTKSEVDSALGNVQSTLTFDNAPTANSDNPVKSSGIKTALDSKQDTLTFDSTPTANSTNPVTSGGVYTALQNVDIDVDTSITQNSTNPVTSAAIYAALQNVSPAITIDSSVTDNSQNPVTSAGIYDAIENAVGAGSLASGVVYDVLWESSDSNGESSVTISLGNKQILDYDELLLDISYTKRGWSGGTTSLFKIKPLYETGSKRVVLQTQDNNAGKIYVADVSYNKTNNSIIFSAQTGATTYGLIKLYGIKFSKNLFEQMYSNVLWENAPNSGTYTTSGNINLSDDYTNYDFIGFICGYANRFNWYFGIQELQQAQDESGTLTIEHIGKDGNNLKLYWNKFTVSSHTQFVLNQSSSGADPFYIRKIVGYKMAKGGYSGIVSDARMTVKSGTVIFPAISSGMNTQQITFDSPMPDSNYEVIISKGGWETTGQNFTNFHEVIPNETKTVNGFSISGYADSSIPAGLRINWIAVRPNSYTREGMVEDVLFSDASGVNSGTINLSGNISDYDLIQIFTSQNNVSSYGRTENIYTSSQLIETMNNNHYMLIIGMANGGNTTSKYIKFHLASDNSIVIDSHDSSPDGQLLHKITGIKFGRYVSGVAVDTTVTQNSNAVVTSGAVYNALQNIPSGGGSGGTTYTAGDGIDITNDEISLKTASANSIGGIKVGTGLSIDANGVLSASGGSGSPTDVFYLSTHSLSPSFSVGTNGIGYYANIANQDLLKIYYYTTWSCRKANSVPAISCIAEINGQPYLILISIHEDGVISYKAKNNGGNSGTTYSSGTIHDSVNNINWYYSGIHAPGGESMSNITERVPPLLSNSYSTILDAATALLNLSNPTITETPIKQELFYPDNFALTSGDTIPNTTSGNTLKSLIKYCRPIMINNETYYFIKLNSGTYYYENPNNTIEIDNQWEVTITAKSSGGGSSVTVDSSITQNSTNPVESAAIYTALAGKQDTLTIDSSITQSSTNPVQGGAVYTALGNKADYATTLSGYGITDAYTKTEVDTSLSSKGDVTTNTDQNITGTKTFVGSKKVGFKQSTANDKLGFTLYGNTSTERGYLEFNPTNTVDGVTGLMTLGNYATSAAGLTQVGFRRYSNISGASGAYNLLMPMVADARTPFSLTTTYTNFYLPLGFKNGSTIVKADKSGVVDISSLLASLEARVAALEDN